MSWGETIFLKKAIDGKKTFRASDNVLVVFRQSEGVRVEGDEIGRFESKTNGQINFSVVVPSYNGYAGTITVKKNGVEITYLSITNQPEEYVISSILNVEKGDIYQFDVTRTFKSDMIYIGADIIDGSLFDYTIGGNE